MGSRKLCSLSLAVSVDPSIIVVGVSYSEYKMYPFPASLYMMSFFAISVVASAFGLYSASAYVLIQIEYFSAKKEINRPASEAKLGKRLVHIYFFVTLFLCFVLLFLGDLGVASLEKASALPGGASQSPQPDAGTFGTKSSAVAAKWLWYQMLIASICAFLAAASHGFAAYNIFELNCDLDSRLGQTEGLCLNQAIFAMLALVISCGATAAALEMEGVFSFSPCALKAIYGVSMTALVLAFVMFAALYFEHKLALQVLAGVSVVLAVLLLFFAGCLTYTIATLPSGEKVGSCALPSLSREYVARAGCPLKYKATSKYITELSCLKEDLRYVWEDNFAADHFDDQLDIYGCLNHGCCAVISADLKIVHYSAAGVAMILALVLMIMGWTAYRFQAGVKELGRMYLSYNDLVLGGHLLMFVMLIMAVFIVGTTGSKMGQKYTPQTPEFMKVDPMPAGTPSIEALGRFPPLVTSSFTQGSFQLTNYTLVENRQSCQQFCDDFVYHVTVTGPEDGELVLGPAAYKMKNVLIVKDEMKEKPGKLIKFKSWFKDVNAVMHMIKFKPGSFSQKSKVKLDIKARQEPDFKDELEKLWGGDRRLRRLDNDFYQGENPLFQIFSKDINFELFSPDYYTIYSGRAIYKDQATNLETPLPSVAIEARSPQFEDKIVFQGASNETGKFEIKLNLLIALTGVHGEILPYVVNIKLSKPGYVPIVVPITVGAYGPIKDYDLGTFLTATEYTNLTEVNVTGKVFDTLKNEGVKGAHVTIGAQKKWFNETAANGEFSLVNVSFCSSPLEVSKDGYYTYRKPSLCETNLTQATLAVPLTPVISGYSLRTVLAWAGKNEDLDLNLAFVKNRMVECDVGHTMRICGGARHHGDFSRKNTTLSAAETVDLAQVGPYQYVFYVEDFAYQRTNPLTRSKAHVDIYSGIMPDSTVMTIDVPQYDRPDVSLEVHYHKIEYDCQRDRNCGA